MILLGQVNNPRMAQAFIDHLFSQKIDCQLQQQGEQYELWLVSTNQQQLAQQQFNEFVANPDNPKYFAASWQSANPQISAEDSSNATMEILVNFILHAGPVTLITFAVAAFIYCTYLLGLPTVYQAFSFFPELNLENITEIWRIFTPALLHFSALHIVFNLLMWWYLGGMIENRLSSAKLLSLLVLASALPNILQFYLTGPTFGGLSGVVYALVGYVWWRDPKAGLYLPRAYIGFMLVWLVLGFLDVLGMKIANGAHLGGLIVGCLLAWIDNRKNHDEKLR